MFTQSFAIAGYSPAWAPEQNGKRSNETAVLDGANFFWNLRGVQSGLGKGQVYGGILTPCRHPAIMWVKNEPLIFTDTAVYKNDGTSLVSVFSWAATVVHPVHDLAAYKWTYAYVGTRHWFSNPLVNELVYYDEFEDVWGLFRDSCWNGPLYGITHADNRLVVLLTDVVTWSKFDEGDKFDCGWQCGAGAQSLALIRYGQPYTVMPYNNGWLTFTSKGIMVSAPTQAQSFDPDESKIHAGLLVFEHQEAGFDDMPLGPCAVDHIDEKQVVWLSTAGFMQFSGTQGGGFGAIQPYALEMSRFYKETVVPAALTDGSLIDEFCLTYARDLKWLFVSSRTPDTIGYTRAHFHQIQLDKWGCFDQEHFAVGFGRVSDEIERQRNGPRHFGVINEDHAYQFVDPMNKNAASFVRLAPMRFQAPNEDVTAQTMSSVQGLRVGVSHSAFAHRPIGGLSSTWLTDEDQNYIADTNARFYVFGCDDDATWMLDEGVEATLVRRHRNTLDYACHTTGVNHSVIIDARQPDQHFDIRHIEFNFFWAGLK